VTTPALLIERCSQLLDDGLELYMAGAGPNLDAFELQPFGISLASLAFLEPDRVGWNTDAFLRLFNLANARAFGPRGLPMPNWVLVDHALLSSGVVIAAFPRERLDALTASLTLTQAERETLADVRRAADDAAFAGPIPVGGYCAAPTGQRGRFTGWSLCSLVPRLGLAFVVKGLALRAYGTEVLAGVTQWDNVALGAHTKFGPARVEAAIVPLHTATGSLVYATDVSAWFNGAVGAFAGVEPTWVVTTEDVALHRELQDIIDARAHTLQVLPPGIVLKGERRGVPVLASEYVEFPKSQQ
jgi:hypothetical protein